MSIHSKDGETRKTKLERISELSANDKNLVFNNLGHLINLSLLKEQYDELEKKKAVGIDGVTKAAYGERLDENLVALLKRIRRGTYYPQPARLVEIPKEDGSTRPLAISCLEDKIVQSAISVLLTKIYEPIFLPCSYGFRPGKNCHDALRALNQSTFKFQNGAVVEIDLRKCFNSISHDKLMGCLRKKINDNRLLSLIKRLLKTPTIVGKQAVPNDIGCPQGSILSPILANIYLHDVLDTWFKQIKSEHFQGEAEMVRYCDDMVFIFQHRNDAERFYRVLPKRLEKYELLIHAEKSQLVPSGHQAVLETHKKGKRLPTYQFLGFTCYFGKTRKGFWRLMYTSRRDRFTAKLKGLRKYLQKQLSAKDTMKVLSTVVRVIRGWINYHGISDNDRRVSGFIHKSKQILYGWFNRRGRRKPMKWADFTRILERIKFPQRWKVVSMF
jgi:group II intron reverse transcriptase/maturase